jgi:transposase
MGCSYTQSWRGSCRLRRPSGLYRVALRTYPGEVTLVQQTLAARLVEALPAHLGGDKAYDSDGLDAALAAQGITMIAHNRRNRGQTQDGRAARRLKRRWRVERLFAWLQRYRRVVVRYEYYAENFLGFVQLACFLILLKRLLHPL